MAEPQLQPKRKGMSEASPTPATAFAPPTAPAIAPAGRSPARRWWLSSTVLVRLAVLVAACIIVGLFTTQWDRWVGDRTRQETDDAYIHGDLTPLSAQIDGDVRRVAVGDFQQVTKGDLLVQIDDADYKARVAQAEAALIREAGAPRWAIGRAVQLAQNGWRACILSMAALRTARSF
jgi:membrane fusion protein, multidrug efflux system